MANKPILIPDGIGFGDETLSKYDEGTWTPSTSSSSNITGTPAYGTATYTRIGNTCFARIAGINDCIITTAGSLTYIIINTTGLPGVTNSTSFFGASMARINSSPYETLPTAVYDADGSGTTFVLSIGSVSGLGVANGDPIFINQLHFSYVI